MERLYKVAGLIVQMNSFGRSEEQARAYLCEEGNPDIIIKGDWRSLKSNAPHLSDDDCEYLTTGSSFYRQLLKYNGLMLHSSTVVLDNKAYLFSAPCGTGKSTHTNLWLKVFKDAYILNDDKPALRQEDGVWYAYGTPWSGKHDISRNECVPVAGICFLHQAKENVISPFGGTKAILSLLEQTVRPSGAEVRGRLMDLLDQLIKNVPIWQMGCNMNPEAAIVSYEAMSGKRKED